MLDLFATLFGVKSGKKIQLPCIFTIVSLPVGIVCIIVVDRIGKVVCENEVCSDVM